MTSSPYFVNPMRSLFMEGRLKYSIHVEPFLAYDLGILHCVIN